MSNPNLLPQPTNLRITSVTDVTADVKWDYPEMDEPVAFCLYRIDPGDEPVAQNMKDIYFGEENHYLDFNLQPSSRYYYVVKAFGEDWRFSLHSSSTTVMTKKARPDTPVITDAFPHTSTSIKVLWRTDAKAEYYVLRHSTVSRNGPWDILYAGLSSTFQHSGLQPGTIHHYRVCGRNTTGDSEWSQPATVELVLEPPPIPANFDIKDLKTNSITLSWDDTPRATTFTIEKRFENGPWEKLTEINGHGGTDNMFFGYRNMTVSGTYSYRMKATNWFGDSDYTNILSAYLDII